MLVFQISKRRDSFIIVSKISMCKLFATRWPINLNTVGTIFRYQPIWDSKPQPMLGNSNKMYHILSPSFMLSYMHIIYYWYIYWLFREVHNPCVSYFVLCVYIFFTPMYQNYANYTLIIHLPKFNPRCKFVFATFFGAFILQ